MNSRVRLIDPYTKDERIYSLVFPTEADTDENRISILSPIGTAMLGHHIGDIIKWRIPAGEQRSEIVDILYQPEAAGDYHL